MATVTAEVVIDVSGLADVDPYINALITAVADGVKVSDGALKSPDTEHGGFITVAAPSGDVIEVFAEMVDIKSSDPAGPMLLNSDGNGYWLRCNATEVRPYKVINYVPTTRMGAATITFNALDQVSIKIDESDGTITSYHNGSLIETLTDTDYTSLKAGFFSIRTNSNEGGAASWGADGYAATVDYTVRKSATGVTVTHTLTADGISTATLDGESLTIDTQSGQDVVLDFDDSIVTSGEYDLVLTDSAAATETFVTQYNVFGLASDTIQKDGVDIGAQTDIELVVLTGAEGSRVVAEQQSALTTDSDGITGETILNDAGLVDTTAVYVVWQSATAEVMWSYETTVELI